MISNFKFVDLFAGIGAFHIALESLGGECVFAAEIDKDAVETYQENFNMDAYCDMFKVDAKDIPEHDVLCAGFPCQAFSQGGHMLGFADTRGTLFFEIERILSEHKTKYIILENVKHLVNHDGGRTFEVIKTKLQELGYILTADPLILSPHQFGIPQRRERLFIIGVHKSVFEDLFEVAPSFLSFVYPTSAASTDVYSLLDSDVSTSYSITDYELKVLSAWNEFIRNVGKFSFPLMFDEFGLDYDVSNAVEWKRKFILNNRALYLSNKEFINSWSCKWCVSDFKLRDRCLEWQAGTSVNSVFDCLIQLRQSGIRCKKPDYYPTLVAMVQTPIIGKLKRRLTPREAARLQSFPDTYKLNSSDQKAFKQLGNSANVEVIKYVALQLFANTNGIIL